MTRSMRLFLLGALVAALPHMALAQDYPSKPVTMVLPFGAGAASDTVARFVAERASKTLGANFVVENRPGATGSVAARHVKGATPDGYTIMISSNSAHAANVYLYKDLPYDPVKDFVAITGLTRNPLVLTVHADVPAKTVKELIDHAKANPGKLNFGVGNTSSIANSHLLMTRAGFEAVQVGYRSLPDALVDLLGKRVDFLMIDPFLIKDHIKAGTLRPLGVTSTTRLKSMPDVPPIAETVPDYELVGWIAAFAPAGTPPEIVDKLNAAFVAAITTAESEDYLENLGMQPFPMKPKEMGDYVQGQVELWSEVLEKAGVERQ